MCPSASLTAPVIGAQRRRSVDVGGLALALSYEDRGHGWGGWDEVDVGGIQCVRLFLTLLLYPSPSLLRHRYAENLIDVRAHTEMAVNLEGVPTSVLLTISHVQ